MTSAVLDASALLALLNAERGADIVAAAIHDAVVCSVNYSEVIAKLVERGGTAAQAAASVDTIDVKVVDFDIRLARRTGELRADTRHRGLSLGDRACLALAEREKAPALTSDGRWLDAVSGIEVRLIR